MFELINSYISVFLALLVIYPIHLSLKLGKKNGFRYISISLIILMGLIVFNGFVHAVFLMKLKLLSRIILSKLKILFFLIYMTIIASVYFAWKGLKIIIPMINRQKQHLHDLELKINYMEAIQDSKHILTSSSLLLQEKLQNIVDLATRHVLAEHGSIMLKNKNGELLVVAATNKKLIGIKRPIKNGISSWVVRESTSLNIDNIKDDIRFNDNILNKYKKNSFLSIPIKTNKDVIGVLNMNDKMSDDKFSAIDEYMLMNINKNIGAFLGTTKYYA